MRRYYIKGTPENPIVEPAVDDSVAVLRNNTTAENEMLTAQIQALTERNEFLEDLIAELAVQAYSTPPSA